MIVTIIRSGGFTGIPFTKIIDTKDLPLEKAKAIEALVIKADFSQLSSQKTTPKPDRFTYTITIEIDAIKNILNISESDVTPELRELIEIISNETFQN